MTKAKKKRVLKIVLAVCIALTPVHSLTASPAF